MSWHEDIEVGLPAPHDDDPPSLRQNIADELADHLQCALNRELLRSPDQSEAQFNVLARFGYRPDQLARRLWFDALQETLMSKRLTLAFVVVLTVVSVTACGLTWSHSQTMQGIAERARAETHQILQARDKENRRLLDQNHALLEKLAVSAEIPPARSLDWNPLKVRISLDNKAETPGEGFNVELSGNAHTASEKARLLESTDAAGIADFGVVRPGTYEVRVTCPWGEYRQLSAQVRPGSDRVVEITVPAGPPEPVTVHPTVQWPESLADKGLSLACFMRRADGTAVGDRQFYDKTDRCFLFLPDGRIVEYDQIGLVDAEQMSSAQTTRADDQIMGTVQFYGQPRILSTGIDWRGAAARMRGIQLVKLAGGEPPENETTASALTPSPYLQTYERMFSGGTGPRPQQSQRNDSVEFNIDAPVWSIVIPEWQVREAIALLSESDHPDATKRGVVIGMMIFLNADGDGDTALSETEARLSERIHRIKFSEFPVTQERFLSAYLESRASRTGGSPAGRSR